jgi:uncharacterized glyoxalase superfamily protein PhnB
METRNQRVRTEIIPYIHYRDVAAALDWLAGAFGFSEEMRSTTPRGGVHGQMLLDGWRIMLGQPPAAGVTPIVDENHPPAQAIFIYLDGVDAHCERARAAGARIEKGPDDLSYGRSYTARDLEGHIWYFTTPPAN